METEGKNSKTNHRTCREMGVDGEIPNKRPRISPDTVGMGAKVLCAEGTPNEKWWIRVIVDNLDDTTYRLFFPDDQKKWPSCR